jgi:hypothetical protein
MSDNLAIINRIIEEHQAIRGHVKLVGDSVSDQEALGVLGEIRSGWVPARLDILRDRYEKLQKGTSLLEEGLRNHFAYEERFLPPIFGELLMRALISEHQEIRDEIGRAKKVLAEVKLAGLSREELVNTEIRIQQVTTSMIHVIEEHALREEVILKMLQRDLEQAKEKADG